MKYKAVIFDLFGTLIDHLPEEVWLDVHRRSGEVLGVDRDTYRSAWLSTHPKRDAGFYGSIEEDISEVCRIICCDATSEQVKAIAAVRLDAYRRNLVPRDGVTDTLAVLRSTGYKIGLLSDCASEIPLLWDETSLAQMVDVRVFSCEAKTTKPDPLMYQTVCGKLSVEPEDCLYVGDGGSYELTGAQRIGMNPVLIRVPDDPGEAFLKRPDAKAWQGPVIAYISEIANYLQ